MNVRLGLFLSFVLFVRFVDADVTQKQIDEAIRKGADYLRKSAPAQGNTDELVSLTLVHAGVKPAEEPLAGMVQRIVAAPLAGTYEVALQAMLLLYLDARKYRPRIADCGQFLIDSQCPNGQWTYAGQEAQKPERTAASGGGEDTFSLREQPNGTVAGRGAAIGDNSNTQFGLLGLWAVGRSRVKVPLAPFRRAEEWWKKAQAGDGGWSYGTGLQSYGSMTCAGICALRACADAYVLPQTDAQEIGRGMEWLGRHFTPADNFGKDTSLREAHPFSCLYYTLYSIERVGALTGARSIGDHAWYAEGCRIIVPAQAADGSWTCAVAGGPAGAAAGGDPVIDTCFAVLFLERATNSLVTGATIDRASVTPDDPASEPADADPSAMGENK